MSPRLAELTYLVGVSVMLGPARILEIPPWIGLGMLALVPGTALFAATVASLISSRVRTYNTAQQLTGLALLPLWGLLFGLAFPLIFAGPWWLAATVAGLAALDVGLVIWAARTWRREQVLALR